MRRFLRKLLLGTASVLALGIAGTALNYAVDPDSAANAGSVPSASQAADDPAPSANMWKDDVRWAQVELRDRGLYNGSLDGLLGPQTKRALGQFQENNGLDQTASLDAQTWEALTGGTGGGEGSSTPPNTSASEPNSLPNSDAGR